MVGFTNYLCLYFWMTFPMILKNNDNIALCGVIGKRKPEIKKSIGKLGTIGGLVNQRVEIRMRDISANSYSFGNIQSLPVPLSAYIFNRFIKADDMKLEIRPVTHKRHYPFKGLDMFFYENFCITFEVPWISDIG